MANGTKNYFRHSFNAHTDAKLQMAVDALGYEGYGIFWVILELCGPSFLDGKNHATIHEQTLRSVLRKSTQSCHNVVTKLEHCGLFVATLSEHCYKFSIPNFSKYLGLYAVKLPQLKESKVKESKVKKSKENEPLKEPIDFPIFDDLNSIDDKLKVFIRQVSTDIQKEWCETWPVEMIKDELEKARLWTIAENRKHKNLASFMTKWFNRSNHDMKDTPTKYKQEQFIKKMELGV